MTSLATSALNYIKGRQRPLVLFISNCQTFGLVNALRQYTSDYQFEALTIGDVQGKSDTYLIDELSKYKHILCARHVAGSLNKIECLKEKVTPIPVVGFDGYHPDIIWFSRATVSAHAPLGPNGSSIVLAAFLAGCSVDETIGYFNSKVYEAAGYFGRWDSAKTKLFADFRAVGFVAEDHFYRWCASGAFMLTTNHPRIAVLTDVARDALTKIGCRPTNDFADCADNLLALGWFPVYPEIAARVGAAGSYRESLTYTSRPCDANFPGTINALRCISI